MVELAKTPPPETVTVFFCEQCAEGPSLSGDQRVLHSRRCGGKFRPHAYVRQDGLVEGGARL